MLSIEERIAYWNMLLRQQPTGNPVVDRVNHEEIRAALRDALADLKAERRRGAAIATTWIRIVRTNPRSPDTRHHILLAARIGSAASSRRT